MRGKPQDSKQGTRNRLVHAAQQGGVTLVLGAGVSIPRGIPSWNTLAKELWDKTFKKERSPWDVPTRSRSPREVPQFLPIVFELVQRKVGEEEFLSRLRELLYANVRYPHRDPNFKQSSESLAVLARLIVQEYERGENRRINAIITLNADDLIEQAVNTVAGSPKPPAKPEIVRMVARSTHSFLGAHSRPLPVYHIHGFLPSNRIVQYGRYYDHMLVFTDTQYWSTSASALTFANRVMASALGEGRCIFIGLSMTDLNLLRWLALRTFEMDRDLVAATRHPPKAIQGAMAQPKIIRWGFERHFWIRPKSDDPSGFLSDFLSHRGVGAVEISSWKTKSFQKLMEECFPEKEKTAPAKDADD